MSDPVRLSISVTSTGAETEMALAGELDPATAPQLDAALLDLPDDLTTLVLDLGDLTYLDSGGLRILVVAHRMMADRGGGLLVRSPTPTARTILEATGLDQVLTIR